MEILNIFGDILLILVAVITGIIYVMLLFTVIIETSKAIYKLIADSIGYILHIFKKEVE